MSELRVKFPLKGVKTIIGHTLDAISPTDFILGISRYNPIKAQLRNSDSIKITGQVQISPKIGNKRATPT